MSDFNSLSPLREFPVKKPVLYVPIPPMGEDRWNVEKVFNPNKTIPKMRYEYAFSQGNHHVYRMTGVEE